MSIRSKVATSRKNKLNVLTFPGLLTARRGACTAVCKPSIIPQILDSDPDNKVFVTALLPREAIDEELAALPWSSTFLASS